MTEDQVLKKLDALNKNHGALERQLGTEKGELTALKRQHAALLEEAKTKFGVSSAAELSTLANETAAEAEAQLAKLDQALKLYGQGNLAGAARVLNLEDTRETIG